MYIYMHISIKINLQTAAILSEQMHTYKPS